MWLAAGLIHSRLRKDQRQAGARGPPIAQRQSAIPAEWRRWRFRVRIPAGVPRAQRRSLALSFLDAQHVADRLRHADDALRLFGEPFGLTLWKSFVVG